MGRIVVTEFISLDGVIEDPGGGEDFEHGGWSFQFARGEEGDKFKLDETFASEALLLGRVTYEGFAKAWPSRKDDIGFAEKFNSMPKYVISTTLSDPSWNNSTVLDGDGTPLRLGRTVRTAVRSRCLRQELRCSCGRPSAICRRRCPTGTPGACRMSAAGAC